MISLTTFIIGLLGVLGGFIGYKLTESYIVMILGVIIMVLIGKSLQPAVIVLWDKFMRKHFPLPDIHEFKRQGLDPTEDYVIPPEHQGLRVIAMTESLPYKKNKNRYEEMVKESLEALSEEFPLFDVRLKAVYRRGLPIQYVWSHCGEEGELMPKCFKAWLKTKELKNMKARTQNKDLFLHDGVVSVNGKDVRYTVMVLFDGELPVTVPKKETEANAENTEENKAE